jgi:hypothetical protein
MKLLDLALSSLFVAGVQMLRLLKHVLWIDANLLGLDNAEQHAVYEEGVIGRAVGCGKLLDSVTA